MSLTLNAPTPYPPLAASSSSCRIETKGIAILLVRTFQNLAAGTLNKLILRRELQSSLW
jgi:hypothetical protein